MGGIEQSRPAAMRSAASEVPCARAMRPWLMLLAVAVWLAVFPLPRAQGYTTFTGPTSYDIPPLAVGEHGLQGVVTADFNGDADPDIAVIHEDPDKVSVLLGAAGGTFTGPTDYALFSSANRWGSQSATSTGTRTPISSLRTRGSTSGTPTWRCRRPARRDRRHVHETDAVHLHGR